MGHAQGTTLVSIAQVAEMSEAELRAELAIMLYAQRRVSLGKATEIAGLSYDAFLELAAARELQLDYRPDDLEEDLDTLRRLGY